MENTEREPVDILRERHETMTHREKKKEGKKESKMGKGFVSLAHDARPFHSVYSALYARIIALVDLDDLELVALGERELCLRLCSIVIQCHIDNVLGLACHTGRCPLAA